MSVKKKTAKAVPYGAGRGACECGNPNLVMVGGSKVRHQALPGRCSFVQATAQATPPKRRKS